MEEDTENPSPIESLPIGFVKGVFSLSNSTPLHCSSHSPRPLREWNVALGTQTVALLPPAGVPWLILTVISLLGHAHTVLFTLSSLLEPVTSQCLRICGSIHTSHVF